MLWACPDSYFSFSCVISFCLLFLFPLPSGLLRGFFLSVLVHFLFFFRFRFHFLINKYRLNRMDYIFIHGFPYIIRGLDYTLYCILLRGICCVGNWVFCLWFQPVLNLA